MPTLQDIKKQRGLTNAAIGRALHVSASTAGMILQGRHIRTFHDEQISELASVLGITFERCWYAMQEHMPDLHITPEEPRLMTTVDGSVVISPNRWIESRK